ncbi:cohesin domain-containing protein [Chakrabartyella piscis]|uniref:cohesin domain-containing protein n=1 Tax=Chakrabartyella piscis TaxID=2918914 RepID=UPI00295871D8|nr:cohesin domain-containing protein [Chakrabartyella piscis]
MRHWKRKIAVFIALILSFNLCMPILAMADTTPVLRVEESGAAQGAETIVNIYLDNPEEICGGNFEIVYDTDNFTLIAAEAGDLLSGCAVTINTKYQTDTIRISFAGSATLSGDAPICTLTLQAKSTATLGDTAVTLQEVRMYNMDVETVDIITQDGTLAVQYAGIKVESQEAVAGQAVRMEFVLEGDLDVAGGGFEVSYDTDKLTAGTVVSSTLLNGYALASNTTSDGNIKVTWAGSEPIQERGTMCSITFYVKEDATGEAYVNVENLRLYDTEGKAVGSIATNGTIAIGTATDASPKIWVVGGQVDAETKLATVGIVLEGRGEILGGEFVLDYPEGCTLESHSTTEYTNTAISTINTETAGTLKFNWAGTAPDVSSKTLLLLEFKVEDSALGEAITLSEVSLLDDDLETVNIVDIRSGSLVSGGLQLQSPYIAQEEITTTANQTSVALTLDVASAGDGTELETIQLMMVLYENGKMRTVKLSETDYATSFDDNGIAQIEVSVDYAGTADEVKLFMVDGSGVMTPLAETVQYNLGGV